MSTADSLRASYIALACNEGEVQRLVNIQLCGPSSGAAERWPLLAKYYFNVWSHLGSGPFYILSLCFFAWTGYPLFAAYMCIALSVTLYITDVIKDALACPRPPSPPVFRGGDASHALEYGFPSTHTGCACVLAHLIAGFFLLEPDTRTMRYQFPGHNNVSSSHLSSSGASSSSSLSSVLIIGCALVFVFHVAFSRMFLGLHWLGDLVGGILVYVAWAIADALFLRSLFVDGILSHLPGWVHWLAALFGPELGAAVSVCSMIAVPLLLGNLALQVHSTPRDACPCFEDSARFVGADCGLVVGSWLLLYEELSVHLAGEKFRLESPLIFPAAVTGHPLVMGVVFYLIGVVLLIAAQEGSVKLLPPVLRPVLRFVSGHSIRSVPHALQVPYKIFCASIGAVIFLRKPTTSIFGEEPPALPSVAVDSSSTAVAADISEDTSPSKTHNRGEFAAAAATAAVVDVPSEDDAPTPTLSSGSDNIAAVAVWSLRCHTHWEEAGIQAKFLSYAVLGACASYAFPIYLFPGMRSMLVELSGGGGGKV